MPKTARQNMLAKVHLAKKDLGLDDADYRHVLRHNFGAESAADLSDRELNDLLTHFKSKGWAAKPQGRGRLVTSARETKPPVPPARQPLMDKIEALLAELGRLQGRRVPWKYAEAILRRQGGPDYLNWANVEQLTAVMQSLWYAVKRAEAKARPMAAESARERR